jgi:hypothetical protein
MFQGTHKWLSFVNTAMNVSVSINCREFLDKFVDKNIAALG